jgi:hypothetical protein
MKKAASLSILIAAVMLAVAVIAEAQQPKKVPRIEYLAPGYAASDYNCPYIPPDKNQIRGLESLKIQT